MIVAVSAAVLVSLLTSSLVRGQELTDVSGHRTLSVAIQVDRASAQLVGFTLKDHEFAARTGVESARPYLGKGEPVQLEVVLSNSAGARYSRRVTVQGLCLEHGPEVAQEIEGDTFRLHRESFLVELPEIAGFDQIEVAYYKAGTTEQARTVLGRLVLDASHFTSGGAKLRFSDSLLAKPGGSSRLPTVPTPSFLTPGTRISPRTSATPTSTR
jgi:hypothetical protein